MTKSNLYITQKSYYFVIRHFIDVFEQNNSEVIYVRETKRGVIKKYKEIISNFGILNTLICLFRELICFIKLNTRSRNISSMMTDDQDLNCLLELCLKNKKYSRVISIGCPCKIDSTIQDRHEIQIFNLHGGILPFQKGRFSPLRSLNRRHKYIGATLHLVSSCIDEGQIISRDFMPVKNVKNKLRHYDNIISLSAKILRLFLKGKSVELSMSIENYFLELGEN